MGRSRRLDRHDVFLAAKAGQNYANLIIRRKLPAGGAPDLFDDLLCRTFTGPDFRPVFAP
jgi:hypothetical protein